MIKFDFSRRNIATAKIDLSHRAYIVAAATAKIDFGHRVKLLDDALTLGVCV